MAVLAISPAGPSDIEIAMVPEGGDFALREVVAVLAVPGAPGPDSEILFAAPLNNGKLLVYTGAYYPWGYSAVFLSVLDKSGGFEFDVVIPTLDDVVRSSFVVRPDNSVMFKTDQRVYLWQYGSTELTLLLYTTSTQYISIFADGSGFCWWDDDSDTLTFYDATGDDYSFIDVPADIRLWDWADVVDPLCIPYRQNTAGHAPFTHGVYNINTGVYTPLFTTMEEYAKLQCATDKEGTTIISTDEGNTYLTAFRFSGGVMLYSIPVTDTMTFNDGYSTNVTSRATVYTEAPDGG